jgi:hypothetical protein
MSALEAFMRVILAAALAVALTSALPAAQTNGSGMPEKFTAFAVDLNNTRPGAAASVVDITINRWSPDADRDRLLQVFRDKGQDVLLTELQKLPVVGYINTPGSLRYDIHFARQRPEPDGGRMIFLMTDRHIQAWEAMNRPRSFDYPFTLIQLKVDKDGNGVGKASVATKITQTKDGTIELEDFNSVPVMLNEVHKVK